MPTSGANGLGLLSCMYWFVLLSIVVPVLSTTSTVAALLGYSGCFNRLQWQWQRLQKTCHFTHAYVFVMCCISHFRAECTPDLCIRVTSPCTPAPRYLLPTGLQSKTSALWILSTLHWRLSLVASANCPTQLSPPEASIFPAYNIYIYIYYLYIYYIYLLVRYILYNIDYN